MAVEFTPAPDRTRVSPVSWPAIFASLAVGISVMLLLTLAGVAVGFSVVEPGADSPRAITMGAAVWQTASMLVAALVGGYVAARLSGASCCPSALLPVRVRTATSSPDRPGGFAKPAARYGPCSA